MTVETFGVERVGVVGYRHTEFGKRVEGVLYPRSFKMKRWEGTDTQALGKGLKESIDPKGCKM